MRAWWPENSLFGMEEAVTAGVTTLELDVVIRSDGQPILSHEPWLSHEICRTPEGQPIATTDHSWNLYAMSVEEIAACDCGGQGHPRFPQQRPVPSTKPTLAELFQLVLNRSSDNPLFQDVQFNIELKHKPEGEGLFHPPADEFVALVIEVVEAFGMTPRVTLQSFSADAMEAIHAQHPAITTAWLVEEEGTLSSWLAPLSFQPSIFSPEHVYLNADFVKQAHDLGMEVKAWTVNDPARLEELLRMGVDGIITDDPLMGKSTIERLGCTVKGR